MVKHLVTHRALCFDFICWVSFSWESKALRAIVQNSFTCCLREIRSIWPRDFNSWRMHTWRYPQQLQGGVGSLWVGSQFCCSSSKSRRNALNFLPWIGFYIDCIFFWRSSSDFGSCYKSNHPIDESILSWTFFFGKSEYFWLVLDNLVAAFW